jgi:Protein of unknown function (DUF3341)
VNESPRYGLIGIFATPESFGAAAQQLQALGFRGVEAYTPYSVEGVDELLGGGRPVLLPLLVFAGAVIGACWGYFIQYWDEVLSYPINVGGRPYNSWPAFTVGTFELTLLFAVAAGFFALLAACRLPLLYHPIFAAPGFERASQDRFVLCVKADDPAYEPGHIRRIFERHGAERVAEVPG